MKLSIIGNFSFKEKFLLKILENNFFFFSDFFFASENSINKYIIFFNKFYRIIKVEDLFLKNPEFIIFSSDFNLSLFWSPIFSDFGSIIIDNSFAWNINYNHKLIIQKINNNFLKISDRIISIPNFLITKLIMILIPILISYKIKKITLFVSQSFSNDNSKLFQSINKRLGIFNVNNFFHFNNMHKNKNFKNEIKKVFDISNVIFNIKFIESSFLFNDSIFINIEFYEKFDLNNIQNIFKNFSGFIIDSNFKNIFNFTCSSLFFSDLIFFQKIKKDTSNINSLNLLVSSNDLRNKPFFNIIQIFKHMYNCSFFI